MTYFEKCFLNSKYILTEGALVERIKKEFNVSLDPFINHAGFIYDFPEVLETLYQQYIDVAQDRDVPLMLMTPTRKVNYQSVKSSRYRNRDIILDSYLFLDNIRQKNSIFSDYIFIGGHMGCKGDAYKAAEALSAEEAYLFHRVQVEEFKKVSVDFLLAGIMPAVTEAAGMAKAMSESDIPYIISFMVRKNGCLLDGNSIVDAIKAIDEQVNPKPLCYMANCIHPLNLQSALEQTINQDTVIKRFAGIQANASSLSPEELNNCGTLQQEDFDQMVVEMAKLYNQYRFKIMGGCCGTNDVFMRKLAKALR